MRADEERKKGPQGRGMGVGAWFGENRRGGETDQGEIYHRRARIQAPILRKCTDRRATG